VRRPRARTSGQSDGSLDRSPITYRSLRDANRGGGLYSDVVSQRWGSAMGAAIGWRLHPTVVTLSGLVVGAVTAVVAIAGVGRHPTWLVGGLVLVKMVALGLGFYCWKLGRQRLLPKGWVDYSARLTPHSEEYGYAAGFWTNRGNSGGARYRIKAGIPADAFMARGSFGQYVIVIPSQRLVVARFGYAFDMRNDLDMVARVIADVIASLPKS